MNRRQLCAKTWQNFTVISTVALVGCGGTGESLLQDSELPPVQDPGDQPLPAQPSTEPHREQPRENPEGSQDPPEQTYPDVEAQALYGDGTYGPRTGMIRGEEIAAGVPVTKEFWHGHGGEQHSFTITAEDFAKLQQGEKVTLTTDVVAGHSHKLFIDPIDPRYRVRD